MRENSKKRIVKKVGTELKKEKWWNVSDTVLHFVAGIKHQNRLVVRLLDELVKLQGFISCTVYKLRLSVEHPMNKQQIEKKYHVLPVEGRDQNLPKFDLTECPP